MRVQLNGKSFEQVMCDRFDELLAIEDSDEMTEYDELELDALGEWYDCYVDFCEACSRLEAYYAENGVEFVK